jgi:glycosyltransferase involved in cell wall biosynthesis
LGISISRRALATVEDGGRLMVAPWLALATALGEEVRAGQAGCLTSRRPILTSPKPTLIIVDGSVAVTGALVSAARQAELLADQIDTVLALPRGHQVPAERTRAFAEVIELPIVPLRKTAASLVTYGPALLMASVRLLREVRRRGCSRVQLNDFYLLHGAVIRLLGFRGRIVTFVRIDPTRFGLAGRAWLAAARRASDELVAVSRFIQSRLGPAMPGRLIYEHVTPGPDTRPSGKHRILLFVGNFIRGKGQEHAIEAFNRIASRFPDALLQFVGGDMGLDKNRAFKADLQRAAAAGPASGRIEFRGASNDLGADYAEAYAALNFSASESFSLTCLDASAAGLPVIATRCGGPEEIIRDTATGFLVPVGDVEAMADRMAWLLDHPTEAATMGSAGKTLVTERFSAARARAAFSELLGLP